MSLMLGVSCHQAWRISYIMIKLKKIIKLYKSWIIKLNLKKKNFLTIFFFVGILKQHLSETTEHTQHTSKKKNLT